jgi:hypothetical protein
VRAHARVQPVSTSTQLPRQRGHVACSAPSNPNHPCHRAHSAVRCRVYADEISGASRPSPPCSAPEQIQICASPSEASFPPVSAGTRLLGSPAGTHARQRRRHAGILKQRGSAQHLSREECRGSGRYDSVAGIAVHRLAGTGRRRRLRDDAAAARAHRRGGAHGARSGTWARAASRGRLAGPIYRAFSRVPDGGVKRGSARERFGSPSKVEAQKEPATPRVTHL